jgi:L-fuconolactonase
VRIDAHQHFWHYTPEEYGWIGPEMAILQADHLPGDLARLTAPLDISGTVAVQARQTLEETRWLLDLAKEHRLVRGVVGWVDLRSPRVAEQLERFCASPHFLGVRHVVQDEPDDQFMLRPDFLAGLATLADHGLTYDILVFPRHLPVACQVVEQFPEQPFVLDHIAKPFIKAGTLEPWAKDLKRLSRFPNVTCKVSGMVTETNWQQWRPSDLHPYLDVVFEAFGPERIMFGSDWPVCTVAGTYAQVAGVISEYVDGLSADEQAAVWGETAARFYGLEPS